MVNASVVYPFYPQVFTGNLWIAWQRKTSGVAITNLILTLSRFSGFPLRISALQTSG
jgi:hypothetical protein